MSLCTDGVSVEHFQLCQYGAGCASAGKQTQSSLSAKTLSAKQSSFNLSIAERQALTEITVRQTEKRGSLAVQNKSDYLREANRLLADTDTYLKLLSDPLPQYHLELVTLVEAAWREGVRNKKKKSIFFSQNCAAPLIFTISPRCTKPWWTLQEG